MQQVECYGLHWFDNIAWLLQGRGGGNFIGLKQKCPLRVVGGACNHLIPAAAPVPDKLHWEFFRKILRDPLVLAALPVPRQVGDRAFFVSDPDDSLGLYLSILSKLSSPLMPILKPIWTMKKTDLEKEMTQTNVQPLILTQATAKNQDVVDAIAKFSIYAPRTVIITGADDVVISAPVKRIKTDIKKVNLQDLLTLPLENLGATVLRRFSRKEKLDGPIESRDDRRSRMIEERKRDQ